MIYSVLCKVFGNNLSLPKKIFATTSFVVQEEGFVVIKTKEPWGKESYRIDCENEYMKFILLNERKLSKCGVTRIVLEYEMHYSLQCNGEISSPKLLQQLSQLSLPVEVCIKAKEHVNEQAYEEWERLLA